MANEPAPHELDARPQGRREWSGWLRSIALPLGLVVVIVGGLLYYEGRHETALDDGYGTVDLPANRNTTGQPPSAEVGRAAPDFILQTIDGSSLRLSDLAGQPLLVNFWATWCGPCRAEMPELVLAHLEHKDKGFMVLAVNQREANARVEPFVNEFTLPFPVLMDRRGDVGSTWRVGGPIQGLPATYFIDRTGVVRKVIPGALSTRTLQEGLDLILGAPN